MRDPPTVIVHDPQSPLSSSFVISGSDEWRSCLSEGINHEYESEQILTPRVSSSRTKTQVSCESNQTYFLHEYRGLTPNLPTTFFIGEPSLAVTFFPAELERTVWFKDVALRAVECCETQNASMEPATRAKASIIDRR